MSTMGMGDNPDQNPNNTAFRTYISSWVSHLRDQPERVPQPEAGSSLAGTLKAIEEAAKEAATDKTKRDQIVEDGALDPAIVTLILSNLTKIYPIAAESQIESNAANPVSRAWSGLVETIRRGRAATATGAALGTAPSLVPIASEALSLASRALGMPKMEVFYAALVSLGFLAAAVAGPGWQPFDQRLKNVNHRRRAGVVLQNMFGEGNKAELKKIRELAADAKIQEMLEETERQVRALAKVPTGSLNNRSSLGWVAGMLGAGSILAMILATTIESRSKVIETMGAKTVLFPGVVASEDPKKLEEQARKIFTQNWSPIRGAELVGGFIADSGRNVAALVGAVDPKRPAEKQPARKR